MQGTSHKATNTALRTKQGDRIQKTGDSILAQIHYSGSGRCWIPSQYDLPGMRIQRDKFRSLSSLESLGTLRTSISLGMLRLFRARDF